MKDSVKVRKIRDKHRLVDQNGHIAKTHLGNAIDGGGKVAKAPRVRQAEKINRWLAGDRSR